MKMYHTNFIKGHKCEHIAIGNKNKNKKLQMISNHTSGIDVVQQLHSL